MKKVIILLVVLIVAGAVGFTVYKFAYKTKDVGLKLSGQLEMKEIDASFKVSGQISKVFFTEGSSIKKGDLLMELDKSDYDFGLKLTEVQLNSAKWSLKELETVTPKTDAIKAKIEQAKSGVEAANIQVQIAKKRVADTKLYSEINGLILSEYKSAGELVQAGFPVMSIGDPSQIWLRAYVPELQSYLIKLGQKMTVNVDGINNKPFVGTISYISDQAEFTPKQIQTDTERVKLVYRVKIDVENPDGVLKPGMPADATLAE